MKKWTEEEKKFVRRHYENGRQKLAEKFGVSKNAISRDCIVSPKNRLKMLTSPNRELRAFAKKYR